MRVLGLFALTACLSRPVGLRGDSGGEGGTDSNVHSTPWPPSGLAIERSLARDVDGDGIVDLVLSSSDGVYVLAGGPQFGTGYQAFVATPFAPQAIDVANLGGAAAPELAVLGSGPTGKARVAIYEGLGDFGFAATPWVHDFLAVTMQGSHRGVWLLDSDGDGAVNVLAADEADLEIGEPAGFSANDIESMPTVHAVGSNSGFFFGLDDVFVIVSAGVTKLVVDDFSLVSVFASHDNLYGASERSDHAYPGGFAWSASAHADLDQDGIAEMVGGGAGAIDAMALEGAVPAPVEYSGPLVTLVDDHSFARLAQIDRDASGRPDLLVMTNGTSLSLIRNVVRTGATAQATDHAEHDLSPAANLVTVEVGDFDHDGATEIIAIARDGTLSCWRYGDLVLVAC